jgi:hypothetical protein
MGLATFWAIFFTDSSGHPDWHQKSGGFSPGPNTTTHEFPDFTNICKILLQIFVKFLKICEK